MGIVLLVLCEYTLNKNTHTTPIKLPIYSSTKVTLLQKTIARITTTYKISVH